MNLYLAFYLIIGAWFAGVNIASGLWRIPLMMAFWPIVLLFIVWQDNKRRKASGR